MSRQHLTLTRMYAAAVGALLLHGDLSARALVEKLDPFGEIDMREKVVSVPTWRMTLEKLWALGYITQVSHHTDPDDVIYGIRLSVLVEIREDAVDDVAAFLHPGMAGIVCNQVRELEIKDPVTNWREQKPRNYDVDIWYVSVDGRG